MEANNSANLRPSVQQPAETTGKPPDEMKVLGHETAKGPIPRGVQDRPTTHSTFLAFLPPPQCGPKYLHRHIQIEPHLVLKRRFLIKHLVQGHSSHMLLEAAVGETL